MAPKTEDMYGTGTFESGWDNQRGAAICRLHDHLDRTIVVSLARERSHKLDITLFARSQHGKENKYSVCFMKTGMFFIYFVEILHSHTARYMHKQ